MIRLDKKMGVRFHHILVVDDDESIRNVVSDILRKMGLNVSSAENGKKGMNLFRSNNFDLVITDFDMPGINGIDFANKIKNKSPTTLILLITGSEKEDILSRIKGTAVDQVLFKPFSFAEVAKTVQELLHS